MGKYKSTFKPRKAFFFTKPPRKQAYAIANNGAKVRHGVSLLESRVLDKFGIKERSKVIILFGKTYVVDGFDPRTNTIYEVNGGFFHGDLRQYRPSDINPLCKKTYAQLNYETRAKYQIWKNCGFKIFYMWEKDIKEGKYIWREFVNINAPL